MLNHWLLITFSWLGTVRPQYINTGGPGNDYVLDAIDTKRHFRLPYYFNVPATSNDYETTRNNPQTSFENTQADHQRSQRTAEEQEPREKRWLPNQLDIDQGMYLQNEEQVGSGFGNFLGPKDKNFEGTADENATNSLDPKDKNIEGTVDEHATNFLDPKDKKYFSPWGGKRDKNSIENMWTWKRASNIREPSMPKRVRFSPWGGKRSGQMVYKPGRKNSKIIFFTTIPELNKIVSNYSPENGNERYNFAGFHFIPTPSKRHPINILALSTNADDRMLREALPFKRFLLESLPKIFKPGHPYLDVNLKKDGKRKVKFSAWGGKRAPPIIGPIWTPATQNIKESTLDTILLIRNSQNKDEPTYEAF